MSARLRSRGFTLVEILVVVLIIGIISAAVLLSVNLTGRDRELEKESNRLESLVNYARDQAELQTREYGVIFNQDGYQFVAYDARRGLWREVYEDDILRRRKLPDGLDFKLVVEAREVVLIPLAAVKSDSQQSARRDVKSLKDVADQVAATVNGTATLGGASASSGLRSAPTTNRGLNDKSTELKDVKPLVPQITIFSNGDLTSFEVTMEREGGMRSVTLSLDDKGKFVAKPLVEHIA